MSSMRRIRIGIIGLAAVIIAGTLGFNQAEGTDLFTSFYFTVITLTTVGLGDITPQTIEGRLVTLSILITGLVFMGVVIGSLTELLVEGQVRRIFGRIKMEKGIAALKDHYIVCGFGRIGMIVCRELHASGVPFVVVEADDDTAHRAAEDGYLCLHGDATDDDDLTRAGILRASGLVSVLASNADNVYVTMSARDLNRRLQIVARGEEEHTARKLARAGASRVISPYEIGGLRMAHAILKPNVIDFIEAATTTGSEIDMEEVRVRSSSPFTGKTLADSGIRQEFGLIIVAVRKPDGRMSFNPSHQTTIAADDVLITMGPTKSQERLAEACS
jgi:voltage-gated potassium channel